MDAWGLAPLPGASAFLAVAVLALLRRGLPRGRLSVALAGASSAVLLGLLSWVLASGGRPVDAWASRAAAVAFLVALPSWLALVLRFGAPPGTAGRGAVVVLVALLADLGLALGGAFSPRAALVEFRDARAVLTLQGGAARVATGVFLVAAAYGVLHSQVLWESARRQRLVPLQRALAGLLLSCLLGFVVSAQTLLYGAAPLEVFALASILFVPACGLLVPVLRPSEPSAAGLSEGPEAAASSGVLLGLGAFLILLAGVGEAVSRFAPDGRVFWFRWGGMLLVGLSGGLWLVPGLRHRLRLWLRVPERGRSLSWDAFPLLEGITPESSGPTLLLLSSLFEQPRGRPAVGLWIRHREGGYIPWAQSASRLPGLLEENPLAVALRRERGVLDLTAPPGRLRLVPAYVENLALVEDQGYRLFLLLQAGDRPFGILALAPRDREAGRAQAFFLEELRGELSLLTWGALVAWSEPAALPSEVLAARYHAAHELLGQLATSLARSGEAAGVAPRIRAAAEETARLLGSHARRLRPRDEAPPAAADRAEAAPERASR